MLSELRSATNFANIWRCTALRVRCTTPIPLHQQQALAKFNMAATPLAESERAAAEVLALPIFPELRQDEQDRVVDTIADFYKG